MVMLNYIIFLSLICMQRDKLPPYYATKWTHFDECKIIFDGVDMKTKERRKEIAPARFFTFTPPELRNVLKEDNLLMGTAQLLRVEDQVYLNLNITINSLLANSQYGSIDHGNVLNIIFIDKNEIKLKCVGPSQGVLSQDRKSYIYAVAYLLPKAERRSLSKKEIDKIVIHWSSGYEEYIIYEVDLILSQIRCLQKIS